MLFSRAFSVVLCAAMLLTWGDGSAAAKERRWPFVSPTDNEMEKLKRDKFVVTDIELRQVFSPYVIPQSSIFITSDSALHAYHMLLEETVYRIEEKNEDELKRILRHVWRQLPSAAAGISGDDALKVRANRMAQIMIGAALGLLGDEEVARVGPNAALISDEVARITAANKKRLPEWYPAGPIAGFDYSRFRPRGFYARDEKLARYFRAVSWLQAIPFRVDDDQSLLAIELIASTMKPESFAGGDDEARAAAEVFQTYRVMLGDPDDWDLIKAAEDARTPWQFDLAGDELQQCRVALTAKAEREEHRPLINDQLTGGDIGLNFRILSAYRTPDAILFGFTVPSGSDRLPTGLEVAAALGSDFAQRCLPSGVASLVESKRALFRGTNLYMEHLDCLGSLLGPPPTGAPAFMAGERWQAKSCQTALAGWALARHTWILQAKQTVAYLSREDSFSQKAFVEPNPEFFRRLGRLARQHGELLRVSGYPRNASRQRDEAASTTRILPEDLDLVDRWLMLWGLCDRLGSIADKELTGKLINAADHKYMLEEFGPALAKTLFHLGEMGETPRDDTPRIADAFYNPNRSDTPYLEVGSGRPRVMFVLYPDGDSEELCVGSVLTYYEFASATRLTDEEWKGMLDRGQAKPPEWMPSELAPMPEVRIQPAGVPWLAMFSALAILVGASAAGVVVVRRRLASRSAPQPTNA